MIVDLLQFEDEGRGKSKEFLQYRLKKEKNGEENTTRTEGETIGKKKVKMTDLLMLPRPAKSWLSN